MIKAMPATIATLVIAASGQTLACSSTEEVMAHFEIVKNAYVAKAPSMTPEQFPIWTGHLERFGDAMGKADFAGACAALDAAAVELGFDVVPAVAAGAGGDDVAGKAAGKSGGKAGTSGGGGVAAAVAPTEATTEETTTAEAPLSQPQADDPEQDTAATGPTPGDVVWTECPRGRCRFRDQGS